MQKASAVAVADAAVALRLLHQALNQARAVGRRPPWTDAGRGSHSSRPSRADSRRRDPRADDARAPRRLLAPQPGAARGKSDTTTSATRTFVPALAVLHHTRRETVLRENRRAPAIPALRVRRT